MKKRTLRLRCGFSLGDIVVLSGAVRELHEQYPGQFVTDIETGAPEVWWHNPYIRKIHGPGEIVDCNRVHVDRSGILNRHYISSYLDLFNQQLGTHAVLRRVAGDIHLSAEELSWHSDVWTLCQKEIPFWIVCSGGKFDLPLKWWSHARYQRVIDHFRGRIQFVQIGSWGNFHPRLEGTIDLRGKTRIRDLIHLVHYAQGVLCGVTSLMHLAAAVPPENGRPREAVIIGGAREPEVWERYPNHEFLTTSDQVACRHCWKFRHFDLPDRPRSRAAAVKCSHISETLPHCMHLISAEAVIARIETLIAQDRVQLLSGPATGFARHAVDASLHNDFDLHNIHPLNSAARIDEYISHLPLPPRRRFAGRGVVICGGGANYFTNAWVCISLLRFHGCQLPVELWYLGRKELDSRMEEIMASLGVRCIDAMKRLARHPMRNPLGWELKSYALLHSRFEEVLLLDADNVAVRNPEALFESAPYKETGAVFWPDYGRLAKSRPIWRLCGISYRDEPEFESGQILINKSKCWRALSLAFWLNDHSEFFYQHIHGDKETFHVAWRKLDQPYSMIPYPIETLEGTMCQHDFAGNRQFQHRNLRKWQFFGANPHIPGFWFEEECLEALQKLRGLWDGTLGGKRPLTRRHGFQFRNGTFDQTIYESVALSNEYQLPDSFERNETIVDVGAHIGSFAAACHARGSRSIHCFEASPENAQLARENLAPLKGIQVRNRAVLHAAQRVDIHAFPISGEGENTGGSSVFSNGAGSIEALALDELLRDLGQVRLLKLDCEGSEWPILMYSTELARVEEICGEYHEMPHHELCPGLTGLDRALLERLLQRFYKQVRTVLDKGNPRLGRFWASRVKPNRAHGSEFPDIARKDGGKAPPPADHPSADPC